MIIDVYAGGKAIMFSGEKKIFCRMFRHLNNLKQYDDIDVIVYQHKEKPKVFNINRHSGRNYFLKCGENVLGSWTDLQPNLDQICDLINQNI